MKIEIISFWYNEAFLAPFFLSHYAPIESIKIILDADTDDTTRTFLDACPRVSYREFKFQDGFNSLIKQAALNQEYLKSDADWILMVDADEFIVLEDLGVLRNTQSNIFFAMLYQVYRHVSDTDLDPLQPVLCQRRHGDPNVTNGINALYKKPIVARGGQEFQWVPGCHSVLASTPVFGNLLIRGAHWAMADPAFCVQRRLARRARQSEFNKANGMGWHNWNVTPESILNECRAHENDPEVIL